jgi:hypothetical protein
MRLNPSRLCLPDGAFDLNIAQTKTMLRKWLTNREDRVRHKEKLGFAGNIGSLDQVYMHAFKICIKLYKPQNWRKTGLVILEKRKRYKITNYSCSDNNKNDFDK